MAHFAEIDETGKVLRVLVVDNAIEDRGAEFLANDLGLGGTWVQTSYNSNFRNKFAGIGDTYDAELDAFIAPKPFPSWTLQADLTWAAPYPYPTDGRSYYWDESLLDWSPEIEQVEE